MGFSMASAKSREDEAYEQGVQDGQKADFMDQVANSMVKGFSLDPRLNEIYQSGYYYGVSHRPKPVYNSEQEVHQREHEQHSNESSGDGSGTELSGTDIIVRIIVFGLIFFAILWFVFAVAIPLLMIDIAAIALIAALTRKHLSKWLLPLSVGGAVLVVVDYNQGWLTKSLATNVSFLAGLVPVLLYINVLAGLIAAYFLIRNFMDAKNPHPENAGELTRRNVITMSCLLLVGCLTVGLQETVSQRRHARQSMAAADPTNSEDNFAAPARSAGAGRGQLVSESSTDLPYFMKYYGRWR